MILERKSKNKIVLLAAFALLLLAGTLLAVSPKISRQTEPVFCTQEARQCPDGSYVGRTEPNCEFAPCAEPADDPWKLFTDDAQGITFRYPEQLLTQYIHTQAWPPAVTVSADTFSCPETPPTSSLPDRTGRRMVDDRAYCVAATSEGAAGSVYTDYTYTTERGGELITVTFTLRYPQCLNYDDPQQTECQNERTSFDLDGVVDRIAASVERIVK